MNEHETFWRGGFGDGYVERNDGAAFLSAKIDMFNKAKSCNSTPRSVIELGRNRGLNANALKLLFLDLHHTGVKIGRKAFNLQEQSPDVDVAINGSIHSFNTQEPYDLVFISGVLIHLDPSRLPSVDELAGKLSNRYVLFSEYCNPKPVEIDYRGHKGKLFKRDFAGEFMLTSFELIDYGFVYSGDPKYKHDDMTWFTMQRR